MKRSQRSAGSSVALAMLAVATLAGAGAALANHPVVVEGNCNVPPFGSSPPIVPGTCGDYDGDGLIGTAEDADGDRVFGTLAGGLSAAGANQNGRVVIVTSGTFAETVLLTGNVTLEAAPGVEANIDAVLQGDTGNEARQAVPGIIVDAPANRQVILRNLVSRNWTEGILVMGDSRVTIDGCSVENNVNYGVHVRDYGVATITDTVVSATGFRQSSVGDFPTTSTPAPGIGIEFEDTSRGGVSFTTVNGSFAGGLVNSVGWGAVKVRQLTLFDNSPDIVGPLVRLQPAF